MSKRFKKALLWVLRVFVLLLILAGIELLWSNYTIRVTRYSLSSEKLENPIRIVFLSDLHGREFGSDNSRLIRKITDQDPDLIAFVGDLFNSDADAEEIDAMCALFRQCTEIAPVYFSLGNHEVAYIRAHGTDLLTKIQASGARVVDKQQYFDLEIQGSQLRIGGYMGYFGQAIMTAQSPEEKALDEAFFVDFKDTLRFKLLLNHIPTGWLDWKFINQDSVDLVLSGHYHGGVIRIPFLEQGLYAPYVGKFPPYTKGIFAGKKATCILTTGMAGSYGLPRFFNPPEICTVDVLPQE